MYYIVFCVLFFFSLIEIVTHKRNWLCFDAVYALMTFMVMFRYGQLSDYTGYEMVYEYPEMTGIADPLYFIIQEFFKLIGINYKGFVMIIGALTMGLSYPFLSKYCNKSIASLFIYYTYEFLVMPMSSIRQGLGVALLLYGFTLILELFALVTPDLTVLFPAFFDGRSIGDAEDSRLVQIVIRLSLIAPVLYLKPQFGTLAYYAKAIYIIGYAVYCLFAFAPTMAGRLEYYFRVFMCLFVAYMIFAEEKSYWRELIMLGVIMIHVGLFFKNMNAFIFQGDYDPDKVTMFNFPYVSIFDEDELHDYKIGQ